MSPLACGVEYANDPALAKPPPASTFAGHGRCVKVAAVRWQDCEPGAWPSWWPDALRWNWSWLDTLLAEWRAAGFDRVTVVLHCVHSAYTAPTYTAPPGFPASSVASQPPKDSAAWGAWQRFARAFCKRYASQVEIVEVLSEWQSPYWWRGGLDEYMRLLAVVRAEAAAVGMRTALGGHTFGGLLDDDPSDATIEARIQALAEPYRTVTLRARDLLTRSLAAGAFDVVDIHSLSAASGIVPAVRRTLAALPGSWHGEFHVGDALPGVPVYPDPTTWQPGQPDLLLPLLRGDAGAVAELERRAVATTAAKLAAMAGVARAHFGPVQPWPPWSAFAWQYLARADGSLAPVTDVLRAAVAA